MSFGNFNQDENQPMAEINTTPLVDVMLVLLIVFMVTMPIITHSIPLNLPESNTKVEQPENKEPVRISINEQGQFFSGTEQLAPEALATLFNSVAKKDKTTVIALAADKKVEHKYVIQALSLAQEAGLSKIGFVTESD